MSNAFWSRDEEGRREETNSLDELFAEIAEDRRKEAEEEQHRAEVRERQASPALARVLVRAVRLREPAESLYAIGLLRKHLSRLEGHAVRMARRYYWSWGDVAYSLGVTRQAVHKRYRDIETRHIPHRKRPGPKRPPPFG
jgi:hypothetical protein